MAYLPPIDFNSGALTSPPDDAAAPAAPRVPEGAAADLSCIGEIFIGAAKLEPVEIWFENSAYPREDELLYEVLAALDDPFAPDLREMPYGFDDSIFDPPPLFLREASAA